MAGKKRYKAHQVIAAIEGSSGIKTNIAERLGCTRGTVDNYLSAFPTVRRAYEEERERIIDLAESELFKLVKRGHWPAIRHALVTIGRGRGYVEYKELRIEGEIELDQQLVWGEAKPED